MEIIETKCFNYGNKLFLLGKQTVSIIQIYSETLSPYVIQTICFRQERRPILPQKH